MSGSGVAFLALGWAAWSFDSDLARAQASDSFLDVMGALILAWSVRLASQPKDARHPLGHGRAEPLGALAIAALAGMLALEVCSVAIQSLLGGSGLQLSPWLLAVFVAKACFKGVIYLSGRGRSGPAIEALTMDARNDVLVASLAVLGLTGARFGLPMLDAWFALPIGVWIGYSGFELGRENIDLLMGRAPSEERQQELLRLVTGVEGVLGAHDLRAHQLGAQLSIYVHVAVGDELTVTEGHDIGQAVELLLEAEPDVVDCAVHIDPVSSTAEPRQA